MSDSFLSQLTTEEQNVISGLREIILEADTTVSERVGKIMSSQGAFVYEQEGIFKYGLAKTTKHFTFHSMVMYVFPPVMDLSKKRFTRKGVVFQKGCINFKTLDLIPVQAFQEVLAFSSIQNFETVIQHYKNK